MKCIHCGNEHNKTFSYGLYCSKKCKKDFLIKNGKNYKKPAKCSFCGTEIFIHNRASSKNALCNEHKRPKRNICEGCGKPLRNNNKLCRECLNKTEKYRQKMSKALKGKSGGYRQGSGRSKGAYFKNQYFDSQFEIDIVKFLDENNIQWVRNTKRFYFHWNDKQTYYIPDFYLPQTNQYLEAKGYWWGDKKEKTEFAAKQNQLNLLVIMQKTEWNKDKNILLNKIMSE